MAIVDSMVIEMLAAENAQLRACLDALLDEFASTFVARHSFDAVLAKAWREKAALHAANDRLRAELRRYTAAQVRASEH